MDDLNVASGSTVTLPLAAVLRRMLTTLDQSAHTDDVLLHRYQNDRDDAAFKILVQGHGGLVFTVCRSVLRNDADAEDAFQASFILLATQASQIRNPKSLTAWLHEVAVPVSRNALRARQRRQDYERKAFIPESRYGEDERVVHEELSGLPDKYRLPLVLFYFDGRTQDAAAAALGLSISGLKKWMERGRELLRNRLLRRGLNLTPPVLQSPSPALVATASALAIAFASGTVHVSALPLGVIALIQTGVKPMFVLKLYLSAGVLTATVVGVALLADSTPSPAPPSKTIPRMILQDSIKVGWMQSAVPKLTDGGITSIALRDSKRL